MRWFPRTIPAWRDTSPDDRAEFLSRLFARKRPASLTSANAGSTGKAGAAGNVADIEQLMAAYQHEEPSAELFDRNLEAAKDWLLKHHSFALTADDLSGLEYVYKAFYDGGPDLNYSFPNGGFFRGGNFPTYADLMSETDAHGEHRSYLATEDQFRTLSELEKNNAIVPIVGNFAGPKALRAVGAYLRQHNATVSAFYTSNVEFYLTRNHAFDRFVANARELPSAPDSLLIRACFDYGRPHPAEMPGYRSATLLQRMPRFLDLAQAGSYATDWDVCTLDYLR